MRLDFKERDKSFVESYANEITHVLGCRKEKGLPPYTYIIIVLKRHDGETRATRNKATAGITGWKPTLALPLHKSA